MCVGMPAPGARLHGKHSARRPGQAGCCREHPGAAWGSWPAGWTHTRLTSRSLRNGRPPRTGLRRLGRDGLVFWCAGPGGRAPRHRRAVASGGPTEASGLLCDAGVGSLEAGNISKHRWGVPSGFGVGGGGRGPLREHRAPCGPDPSSSSIPQSKGATGALGRKARPSPHPARDPGTRELHWPQGLQSPCQGISSLPTLVRLVGSRGHDRWKFWKR